MATQLARITDLIQAIGADIKFLKSVSSVEIDPMAAPFNAKGDGTTNDRAAFQAALDYIKTCGGGTLNISGKNAIGAPRKYLINGNVTLPLGVPIWIKSDGGILCKTQASPYTYFNGPTGGNPGYGSGPSNVRVTGLTFTGSFNPDATVVSCAFGLHHSQNWLVENCQFIEMQGSGHIFDLGGCDNITFRKCVFKGALHTLPNTGKGERAECIQLDSSYNGATSTSGETSGFDGLLTRNVTVDDCEFLPLTNAYGTFACPNPLGSHSFREDLKYENIWFINNLVIDPAEQIQARGSNQNGTGPLKFGCIDGLWIMNNTIINTTNRVTPVIMVQSWATGNLSSADPNINPTTTGTFATPNTSQNINIVGNKIVGFKPVAGKTPQPAIVLQGVSGGRIDDVLIEGNKFRNGYDTASATGESAVFSAWVSDIRTTSNKVENYNATFYINNCLDATITQNQLSDVYGYNLYSSVSQGIIFSSNNIRKYRRPVQFDSNSSEISITGNIVSEAQAAASSGDSAFVNMAGAKRFTITGNTVTRLDGVTSPQAFSLYSGADFGTVSDNTVTGYTTQTKITGTPTSVDLGTEPLKARVAALELANDLSLKPNPYVEGVPLYIYGHSFTMYPAPYNTPETGEMVARVASRLRFGKFYGRGRSGTPLVDQIPMMMNDSISPPVAPQVSRRWTPGDRGVVLCQHYMNEIGSGVNTDSVYMSHWQQSLRTEFALMGSGQVISSEAATRSGTWTKLVTGSEWFWNNEVYFSTSIGAQITFTIPSGDECWVLLANSASAYNTGVARIKVGATVHSNITTQGKMSVFTSVHGSAVRNYAPAAYKITGLNAMAGTTGSKTVTVEVTEAKNTFVSACFIPSTRPPRIFYGFEVPRADVADTNAQLDTDRRAAFRAVAEQVIAEFPYVTGVDLAPGWDRTTMVGSLDTAKFHPNDAGMMHHANKYVTAINQTITSPIDGVMVL